MLASLNPYRLLLATILVSTFLLYIFKSGAVAYMPVMVMVLIVLIYELITYRKIRYDHAMSVLTWLPYSIWASFVYFINPFEGKYFSGYLLTFILFPVLVLSFVRLFFSEDRDSNYRFIYHSLVVFVFSQLVVCVGQIFTYTYGFGFPVSEYYSEYAMVSGTFVNSNDLSAAILAILFFIIGMEKFFYKSAKNFIWIVSIILLVLGGSRSAIILAMLFFTIHKVHDVKRMFVYCLSLSLLFVIVFFYFDNQSEVATRVASRIESITTIFKYGVSADNSMSIRIMSYLHFLKMLPDIGFGSMMINEYHLFSENADFGSKELLFQNPHSLVVELGYWLGWPGLIMFFIPMLALLKYSRRKMLFLTMFILVGMIPSSILGSMVFFMILILNVFDYRELTDKNQGRLSKK